MRCDECKWGKKITTYDNVLKVECHKEFPVLRPGLDYNAPIWPWMSTEDFCGDYERGKKNG